MVCRACESKNVARDGHYEGCFRAEAEMGHRFELVPTSDHVECVACKFKQTYTQWGRGEPSNTIQPCPEADIEA